ncbi:MAG TPA: CHAT domain-containing protein [Thermoanaerobaculia bacterium]
MLAEEPDCTDEAVEALQRFSRAAPDARPDLGAAFYIRFKRYQRPSDLLRAYDALATAPDTAATRVNRALIEEALGHKPGAPDPVAQWTAARDAALRSRDAATAAKLIAPFPGVAQVHFEDHLFEMDLAAAELFAEALYRNTKDPLARDVVRAMRADRRGVAEFHVARGAQIASAPSEVTFGDAERLLSAAGNPLLLVARQRHAQVLTGGELAAPLSILDAIEPEARRRGYLHLLARIHSLRGYCLSFQGNFIDSLPPYQQALQQYDALHDYDGIAGTRSRIAGIRRKSGDIEGGAREALRALRDEFRVVDSKEHQNVNGEVSAVAVAIGSPHAAMHYADRIIGRYQARIKATNPSNTDGLGRLRNELAIGLRNRAIVAAELRDYARANADLNEAERLHAGKPIDPLIRHFIDITLYESRGRASALDPREAVASYNRALALAADDEFLTMRASLYAQRAEALLRMNRQNDAAADLQRAVRELETEERRLFEGRDRRSSKRLPPGYFARFQDTYLHLIRHYIDQRDVVQALMHAEYARGPETKKLLAQLRLRDRAQFASIRARLPENSTMLLYSVMDDRTYVWVVSATRTSVHRLKATAEDVERWTRALYRAGHRRRPEEFDDALFAPYAELIAPALRFVDTPRLVIVPDGAMHGLPFAALRNPDTRRYLVQNYVIETAPSATLYAYARVRDAMLAKSHSPSLLAIGNPAFDTTLPIIGEFPSLPHAALEAQQIAGFYRTKPLIGDAATVQAFLTGTANADIVHFAGHAVVNAAEPESSYLLMAPSPPHRGVLTADELLDGLRLDRTRLVVLSACRSAGGREGGNDGVAPLVRPILTAGVPAVIGSLWNVNDATTRELLVSFHRHYRQHKDAAVALREAQLSLIRKQSRGYNTGTAWAPFQVIGHASSPFAPPATETEKGEPP